jgi:predicted membrane metal-binding protein
MTVLERILIGTFAGAGFLLAALFTTIYIDFSLVMGPSTALAATVATVPWMPVLFVGFWLAAVWLHKRRVQDKSEDRK